MWIGGYWSRTETDIHFWDSFIGISAGRTNQSARSPDPPSDDIEMGWEVPGPAKRHPNRGAHLQALQRGKNAVSCSAARRLHHVCFPTFRHEETDLLLRNKLAKPNLEAKTGPPMNWSALDHLLWQHQGCCWRWCWGVCLHDQSRRRKVVARLLWLRKHKTM